MSDEEDPRVITCGKGKGSVDPPTLSCYGFQGEGWDQNMSTVR